LFYCACRNGHTAVAALLLECKRRLRLDGPALGGDQRLAHGADLTIRDARFASTPEGWAAEGKHDEIRELLHR
jgi:hypothetical protein